MIKVIKASEKNLDEIVPLFDAYRIFYEQPSNIEATQDFLLNRLKNKESVLFLAYYNNTPVGFTQLYPVFSSVSLQSFYILNDLYVTHNFRGKGIGEALLNEAKNLCQIEQCKGLSLETAIDNPAQKLYEKLGWKKDTEFLHYFWARE